LPFKDSSFSLTLISTGSELPGLQALISELSTDFYKNLFQEMSYGRAMVFMPRMKLSYKNVLNDLLIEMGMTDAFSKYHANFENIGKPLIGPRIFINQVVHKSVLEIDEKGAEGAAATSVGFGVTSLPPVLRFDRPFILCLRHIETNSLIFIGRVMNPAE
jgi:serine protease inhibitor